jgi:hypothetical protein
LSADGRNPREPGVGDTGHRLDTLQHAQAEPQVVIEGARHAIGRRHANGIEQASRHRPRFVRSGRRRRLARAAALAENVDPLHSY